MGAKKYLVFDCGTTRAGRYEDNEDGWAPKAHPVKDFQEWEEHRLIWLAWTIVTPGYRPKVKKEDIVAFPVSPKHFTELMPPGYRKTLERDGYPLFDVLYQFLEACNGVDGIVSHNLKFDHSVIASEIARATTYFEKKGRSMWFMSDEVEEGREFFEKKLRDAECTDSESGFWCTMRHQVGAKEWITLKKLTKKLWPNADVDDKSWYISKNDVEWAANCFLKQWKAEIDGKSEGGA